MALCLPLAALAAQANEDPGESAAVASASPAMPFALQQMTSESGLSGGRPNWNSYTARLQWRESPDLTLGAFVNRQSRPPDLNIGYGIDGTWQVRRLLEWHASAMTVPHATILPMQTYATGLEWRASPRYSVAADYRRLNFGEGSIDMIQPAAIVWFDDDHSRLTLRYAYGRAFGTQDFHAFSVQWVQGLANGGQLSFSYARGADPEKDSALANVLLTNAAIYSVYYRYPVNQQVDLILGVDYEDRFGLYTKRTASLGLNVRF